MIMPEPEFEEDWQLLPGPKWNTALSAKTWLIEKRRQLRWSHKDVENAFWNCAAKSDLYIGPGGGERFPRATEKRVARFEKDGSQVPLWMHWIPLAAQYFKVPASERQEWERHNIPSNTAERQDLEEADYQSRLYQLSDQEIALVCGFRELGTDEQTFLCRIAQPKMLAQVIAMLRDSTSPPQG